MCLRHGSSVWWPQPCWSLTRNSCNLSSQVRDLMLFIEGQRQIAGAAAEDGLAEGSISLPPTPQQPVNPPSSSKRRAGRTR